MLKGKVILFLLLLACFAVYAQNPVVQFVLPVGSQPANSEGVIQFGIAVEITNFNSNATSVDINVLPGGSATHGVDYTYSPVTVTFPAGTPYTQIVYVYVTDDSIADANKSFTFKLANPTNGATIGADSEYVVTLLNDDTSRINLPVNSLTVKKDTGLISFPVNLNLESDSLINVSVQVVTAGTTAVAGVDYAFNPATIAWPAFTRGILQVPVTIINDALIEPNRTIEFTLVNPTNGALITDSIFRLTILEDDSMPPAILSFQGSSDTVADPDSTVLIYIPVAIAQVYNPGSDTIIYTVAPDVSLTTAVQGHAPPADYIENTQQAIAPPGFSTDTVYMYFFPDPQISPTKKVVLHFTQINGSANVGMDSLFTVYITNRNKLSVSFLGAGLTYPKDDSLVFVPVVMSTFPSTLVSVDVSLAPGSAVYGQDFTFTDTTIIFPPYSMDTQGVWVHLINNSIYQPNKQINFNLSNPSNGVGLGITGYTLTIINDDSLLSISNSEKNNFSLFPNPSVNSITVQNSWVDAKLEITNMLGQMLVEYEKLNEDANAINISSLPSGTYIITIKTGDKTLSQRFAKVSPY